MVSKTAYVIPKKPSGSQSPSGHAAASTSSQKPSSAPTVANETRNLPVSPAPSAPSSRPSQPNNLVRQSIQRSLTGILFKRVCDCEDLEMSESEAAKLVASIEMEMFDIFRNTDSKYMNKYRTIMFNLKDPRNKGLLCRVVRGEIGPFRLVRMSQKDMQAVKAPEPSPKETKEASTAKGRGLQKPEAVKIDLPTLNPTRPNKKPETTEQKKSVPPPLLKTKARPPSQTPAVPDILSCMLKDTTSEHKAHLFDLKCKICTGQMLVEDEEPKKKKPKPSVSREKHQSHWRRSTGNDSPLRAPPDSPDMTSSTSFFMESSSNLVIDSPVLTIVESPASPVMDSPASPTMDSPASPVMDSPASPVQDSVGSAALKRGYTPVVIPTVSTVSITRRDPRTAANRFSPSPRTSASSNTAPRQANPQVFMKDSAASQPAPAPPRPPPKALPKSILMKPASTVDPRLYGTSARTVISQSPADETVQFLAKQDILWKGFLNMLTVAKFVTKGYLVSGSPESLKADLPDTIQIGGRILPQTVWDYVAKLKTSLTKELCVIRFQPATEEEEVAYVSLFSYFSSRGRFGVVANGSRSIKDFYLVPLSAKEAIPSILQPLEGPGLETNRPNLLLGLAVVQKTKRPGSLPQEMEEKRPKVHMSKDPAWIPKPPVLYGTDKLEIFQPYDPETPGSTTPPLGSPACPGSPSDSSSSSSVPIPSLLTSMKSTPPVTTSANVIATQSTSSSISDNNPPTTSGEKKAIPSILKTLFKNNSSDVTTSSDVHVPKPTVSTQKISMSSDVSRSMMDPIVQQYGHKSKAKKVEEEENEFDRPYDPEDEYDPSMGYKMVAPQTVDRVQADDAMLSENVEDDVAYDPEDETIFQDIQSDTPVKKPPVPTEKLDSPSCPTPVSNSTPAEMSLPTTNASNLPTGTVVVSAATLSEQQRMLEELNKQIEEQKRQLKEQEEALRQQREAVGMFMAQFSVSDSLMSPSGKSLPLNKLPTLQSSIKQTDSKPPESTDKETSDICNVDTAAGDQNVKIETNETVEQDVSQENAEDSSKSAGEIEDSDVAYDPEDESLFDEIQEDVFKGSDSISRPDLSGSNKGKSPNSLHSRKHKSSPKKRSRRGRERHHSPSRHSQQRSPSHSRRHRERDRHRKSERDRSRHRARDHSERQGHHRKGHSTRRHSHGQRRSSSSSRKRLSLSPSPKQFDEPFSEVLETSELDQAQDPASSDCSQQQLHNINRVISEPQKCPSPQKQLLKPETATGDDAACALSSQVEKSSQQDDPLYSKIVTTVPLREIDPPIRDSPESPDPEPQFAKPSHTVTQDCVMNEENKDCVNHSSLSNGGYTTDSNQISTSGKDAEFQTNDKSLDFRFLLNLQNPNVRDQGVIEPDKQMTTESPSLRHSDESCQSSGGEPRREFGTGIANSLGVESSLNIDSENPSMKGLSTNRFGTVDIGPGNARPDCKGSRIAVASPDLKSQSQVFGPLSRDLNWNRSKSDVSNACRGPDHSKSDPGKKGASIQDNWRIHQTDREGGNTQKPMIDVTGKCQESGKSGPEMRDSNMLPSRHTDRGPEAAPFFGPRPENIQINSDIPVHGRRGPVPAFIGPNEIGPTMDIQRPDLRVKGLPDFVRPEPGLAVEGPGSNTRGHPGPQFQRSAPDRGGPVLENQIPHMRGSDVRGLWPERRGPGFVGPGPHQRGPWGMGPESTAGPDRSESIRRGPEEGVQRVEGRAFVPPDFIRPRNERRNQTIEAMGPGVVGPGCPELSLSGPQNTGLYMDDTIPDPRKPGGQDFRGQQPENRGFLDCPRPDRRGPGSLEFQVPQPENSDSSMDGPGANRRVPGGPEFREPQLENRGLFMEGPQPDRRGPGGPQFRGPPPENRGSSREGSWPEHRKPEGPDFRGPGPDNRGLPMHGPRPDRRADFRGPGPDKRGLSMDGPPPDRRGPGDLEFRGPGPENTDLSMHGPERRGHGSTKFMGPQLENRVSMDGSVHDRRGHGGPEFRCPGPDNRSISMDGLGDDHRGPRGPDFKGQWPENRDLPMDRPHGPDRPHERGSGGPDFRGPCPKNRDVFIAGPGPDRIRLRGPDFGDPGFDGRGPAGEMRSEKRLAGGPDCIEPEPQWRGPIMEGSVTDPTGHREPNFRARGRGGRGSLKESFGPGRRGPGGPDLSQQMSHGRDPMMGGPRPERGPPGGLNFSWSEQEQRPINLDFEGPGFERRPPPIDESMPVRRAPCEQNYRGQDFDRRQMNMPGAGLDHTFLRPERTDLDGDVDLKSEDLHSHRQETEDYSLQEFGPEMICPRFEGPEPVWEGLHGPDFRKPGIRPKPPHTQVSRHDRRENWRGPELTDEDSNREVPGFEGTGQRFRGPSPVRRNVRGRGFNIQEFTDETRFSEDNWKEHGSRPFNEQDQEHSWQGPFCERRGRGGRGQSWRHERPMRPFPSPREDALDEWNDPGDLVSGPDQNDPHMLPSGPRRDRPDKWRQPDHENSRHFFPDSDDHGEDGRPGLSIQDDLHVEYEERQPAIRGRLRAPRGKGPGAYMRGPDDPYHNRREFNMESCDRRGPGGPRFPGPVNRHFGREDHGTNEGLQVENPEPGTQRFEHNLRPERRGPPVRQFGSNRTDMRGPMPTEFELDRCSDTVTSDVVGPVSNSRGPHAKRRELEHRGPRQVVRYQDPSLVNRPASPHPHSGGKVFPGKPPRHRGALLPTPTEGLIRFPNHMNKKADVFSMKQNNKSHPVDRQQSRSESQEKEKITAQKSGSPALKISTPAGEKTAEGPIKEQSDGIDKSAEIKTT